MAKFEWSDADLDMLKDMILSHIEEFKNRDEPAPQEVFDHLKDLLAKLSMDDKDE